MATAKQGIDACLNCSLWVCDDKAAECYFVQINREKVSEWYANNADRKKAYVAEWSRQNMSKKVAANRRYRERKRAETAAA